MVLCSGLSRPPDKGVGGGGGKTVIQILRKGGGPGDQKIFFGPLGLSLV